MKEQKEEQLNPKDILSIKDWLLEIASKSSIKVLGLAIVLTLIILPVYTKIASNFKDLKDSISEIKQLKEDNKKLNSKLDEILVSSKNLENKIDTTLFILLQQAKSSKEIQLLEAQTHPTSIQQK